jgi:hypothetical protein
MARAIQKTAEWPESREIGLRLVATIRAGSGKKGHLCQPMVATVSVWLRKRQQHAKEYVQFFPPRHRSSSVELS